MKPKLQRRSYLYSLILFIILGSVTITCCPPARASETVEGTSKDGSPPELKGQFIGSSYKAKLISIKVDGKIVLVPYDEGTVGLGEVEKGANITLKYQGEKAGKKALAVLPELISIPNGVTEIKPEDLLEIITNPSPESEYLLIDCRPAEFYAEAHLPTAVSIPWTQSKEEKGALLPTNKDTLLIFYCLGATCVLGPNSAALAAETGYKNINVMLGELSDWQDIGGQLFSSDNYISNGNIILIDLRSPTRVNAGHISKDSKTTVVPTPRRRRSTSDNPPDRTAGKRWNGGRNSVPRCSRCRWSTCRSRHGRRWTTPPEC